MVRTHHPLIPREPPALLSIVIPVYNEAEALPLLLPELKGLMDSMGYPSELILVNDGSSDATLDRMIVAARHDERIQVLSLARNFGHQVAATAGLDHATGDAVVLMDADLQDPPQLVHEMVHEYCRGYDVVYAQRVAREGETLFKRATAWTFYRVMRLLIHPDLPVDVGDFRLVSRQCLDVLKQMREVHRFLRGMVAWMGFPQTAVPFVRAPRAAGRTKYPFRKMILLAWNAAVSFSPLPLRLVFGLGVALIGLGGFYGIYSLVRILGGAYLVPGWTSIVVLMCLIGGAIMISLGIIGEYIGRTFEEIKCRPLYVLNVCASLLHGRRGLSALHESSDVGMLRSHGGPGDRS